MDVSGIMVIKDIIQVYLVHIIHHMFDTSTDHYLFVLFHDIHLLPYSFACLSIGLGDVQIWYVLHRSTSD